MKELASALKGIIEGDIQDIEAFSQRKLSPTTLKTCGPLAWSALVAVSKRSECPITTCTALGKIMRLSKKYLQMEPHDLDKLLANVSIKLLSGAVFNVEEALQFLTLVFDNLSNANDDELSCNIRRLSIQTPEDDAFGIAYKSINPGNNETLQQCLSIALEGLLKVCVLKESSFITGVLDEYLKYNLSKLTKLLAWLSKIPKSPHQSEECIWIKAVEFCKQSLLDWETVVYLYQKRNFVSFSPSGPVELGGRVVKGSVVYSLAITSVSQMTDYREASILLEKFTTLLQEPTTSELKALLPALDYIRGRLTDLLSLEGFPVFISTLNRALIKIKFPAKYAASWGTFLLKVGCPEVIESTIELLFSRTIDSEFAEKCMKAVAQTVCRTERIDLLQRLLEKWVDYLPIVLENVTKSINKEMFQLLTDKLFSSEPVLESTLRTWTTALNLQIIPPKVSSFMAAKSVALYTIDSFKAERLLDSIMTDWSEDRRTLAIEYFSALNGRLRKRDPSNVLFQAIKNRDFTGITCTHSDDEIILDAQLHFLNLALKSKESNLIALSNAFPEHFLLFTQTIPSSPHIQSIHFRYQSNDLSSALRRGYEVLKGLSIQTSIDFLHVAVYLFRLAAISGNLVESKWFLKQIMEFARNNPGVPSSFTDALEEEMNILTGKDCFDAELVEEILGSPRYALFTREQQRLRAIKEERAKISTLNILFCTSLASPNPANHNFPFSTSFTNDYLSIQEARIALFWESQRGRDADFARIKKLFIASLGYSNTSSKIPSNTLGLLWDPMLEVLFVYSSPLVLFRFPVRKSRILPLLRTLHSISFLQNTETLRNTAQIAADPQLRSKWWQTRRDLDSQLQVLVKEIDELLFNGASFIVPNENAPIEQALNLSRSLTALTSIDISPQLAQLLLQLGSFPTRPAAEALQKLLGINEISQLRKAFLGIECNNERDTCNLLLDKHLACIPWECLPTLSSTTFKRIIPIDSKQTSNKDSVFYIINPSGDLIRTQERFQSLFNSIPGWMGIVGRKPSQSEFLSAIQSSKLFMYFGHAAGEIYAPLQELQESSAVSLLIGCSSGRIKANGIFPPQSPVFHYLQSGSPLVLGALWDVTDKDIDTFTLEVMKSSGLLSDTLEISSIAKETHFKRSVCNLKALNGYAPITYTSIK